MNGVGGASVLALAVACGACGPSLRSQVAFLRAHVRACLIAALEDDEDVLGIRRVEGGFWVELNRSCREQHPGVHVFVEVTIGGGYAHPAR